MRRRCGHIARDQACREGGRGGRGSRRVCGPDGDEANERGSGSGRETGCQATYDGCQASYDHSRQAANDDGGQATNHPCSGEGFGPAIDHDAEAVCCPGS